MNNDLDSLTSPPVTLSQEQLAAVDLCTDLDQRLASVTGGAGTGKTVVLGQVYQALIELLDPEQVVLAAPTGRAAKRITELTSIPAMTIHRLLEFPSPEDDPEDGEPMPNLPKRNRSYRLDQRVVIIDESSMLGPTLYRQLMDALPNHACVRFFGDNNQLPPVEDGEPPFEYLLERHPAITLTWNYRSNDEIVGNAIRVLNGSIPQRNHRFEIIYTDQPIPVLLNMVKSEGDLFSSATGQILTPARRGQLGSRRLNPSLQTLFNPHGPYLQLRRLTESEPQITVRANDKGIWIKNNYKLALFNGEIGTFDNISPDDGSFDFITPDGAITIPPTLRVYNPFLGHPINTDPRREVDLGYAITTHKAQGSEFDTVILCQSSSNGRVLVNRRAFYTAITRARTRVIIITDRSGMRMAMRR